MNEERTCTLCGRTGTRGFRYDYVSKSWHCSSDNACYGRQKRYKW